MSYTSKDVLGIKIKTDRKEDDVNDVMLKAREHGEKNARKSFPLSPSAALKPDLDLYYDLVNHYNPGTIPKDSMEGRVHILLDSGHHLEDFIVNQYGRAHEILETNIRVPYGELRHENGDSVILRGEFDFTFIDKYSGEVMLGDAKTSSDYAFKASKSGLNNSPLPKEEHIAQLNLYMHSKYLQKQGVKTARIIYYNKNNSDYDVYEFEYSKELAEKTLEKFQRVFDLYLKRTEPPQEYFWGQHWKAAYGSYRTFLHKRFDVNKEDRKVAIVSNEKFTKMIEGTNSDIIKRVANEIGSNIIKTKDGKKSLYLNLTQRGLSVRLKNNSAFTEL